MSSHDVFTQGIPVADEQLPDVSAMTAEDVYEGFQFGSVDFSDLLMAHVEKTIEALRALPQMPTLQDAITHLDHYLLELGYEAERDY